VKGLRGSGSIHAMAPPLCKTASRRQHEFTSPGARTIHAQSNTAGDNSSKSSGSASWIPRCLPGERGPMGKNCRSPGQHDRITLTDGASGCHTSAARGGGASGIERPLPDAMTCRPLVSEMSGGDARPFGDGHVEPGRQRGACHDREGLIAEMRGRLGRYSRQMDVLPVCGTQ
jgi:hypothetical protein